MDVDNLNLQACHYKGAASEFKAAAYFLERNCQVYWPATQQSAVDFIVEDNGFKKVQVKTATMNKVGELHYLQCRTRLTNKYQSRKPKDLYDLLVVIYEGELWVIPAEVIDSSNISLRNAKWEEFKRQ